MMGEIARRRWYAAVVALTMLVYAAGSAVASPNEAGLQRGLLYLQMDLPELGLQEIEKSGAASASLEGLVLHGLLLQALGRLEEAERALRAAGKDLREGPASLSAAVVQTFLAGVLAARGQVTQAASLYRQALAADPGLGLARVGLARILSGQGEIEEAIAQYRTFLEENPEDAEALAALGELYARTGRVAEAREALETALRLNPDLSSARETLSGLARTAGETPPAGRR